jgi:hypothetical protein
MYSYPSPAACSTTTPTSPKAWLLARMSQLARDAGDARATASWELRWRYYLKRIEGDDSPESPYRQWTSVGLLILHGDYAGGDWMYWLLDRDSHNVLSQGIGAASFDTSRLPPPEEPITLEGGDAG